MTVPHIIRITSCSGCQNIGHRGASHKELTKVLGALGQIDLRGRPSRKYRGYPK